MMARVFQRDVMRRLYLEHEGNEDAVVHAYAAAEERGEVPRESNTYRLAPIEYARALFADGVRKGWLRSN
jgi:hypothetical protein